MKSSWENRCWNNIILDQPAIPQWHGRPQPGWPRQDQRWRRGGFQKTFTISLLLLRHHHWQGHRKKIGHRWPSPSWPPGSPSLIVHHLGGLHIQLAIVATGHDQHLTINILICLAKYLSSPYFLQASRNHRHVWYVAIFYFIFAARPQADNPCLPDLTRKSCPITQHHTPSILS